MATLLLSQQLQTKISQGQSNQVSGAVSLLGLLPRDHPLQLSTRLRSASMASPPGHWRACGTHVTGLHLLLNSFSKCTMWPAPATVQIGQKGIQGLQTAQLRAAPGVECVL